MTIPMPTNPWEAVELARRALGHAVGDVASETLAATDLHRYSTTLTGVLNRLAELIATLAGQMSGTGVEPVGHGSNELHAAVAALNDAASYLASYSAALDQPDQRQ